MDREQLAQARPFVGREVFRALEQQPSRLGEHGISSTLSEKADFRAADLVDALTELLCDCGIRSRIRTAHRRRSHECRREADVPSPSAPPSGYSEMRCPSSSRRRQAVSFQERTFAQLATNQTR
jgi:hypothetical protein